MWNYIIEYKHLFSTDATLIKKYCDAAPFTQYFGNNSAPKAGSYLGFKIIESFMSNHKEMPLNELLNLSNSQQILEKSRYRPD